jgi:hypothetical protein
MKPVKNSFKGGRGDRKSNRGGEFDQSTSFAYVEISQ